MANLKLFFRNENGATAIEYALMASAFAIAVVSAVKILGLNVGLTYDVIESAVR